MKRYLFVLLCLNSFCLFSNDSLTIVSLEDQQKQLKRSHFLLERKNQLIEKQLQMQLLTIDSLKAIIDESRGNIKQLAQETGIQIKETHKAIESNKEELISDTARKAQIGLICLVGLLILCAIIYLVLYRRMNKGTTAINKINEAQQALQEESIQLDNKLIELLNKQINQPQFQSAVNKEIDHSLALKVADEIIRIETNLSRMDTSIKGYKQLLKSVERIKNNFLANGYEMVDMLSKPYTIGIKAAVTYITDESLIKGEQIISRVIKPQVNFNGVMIQSAQIEVSQGE